MKITVELPETDLRDICRFTGLKKRGPAIRKMLDDALRLQRRTEISSKFLSGEWSASLKGFEATKAAERRRTTNLSESTGNHDHAPSHEYFGSFPGSVS